MPFNIIAVLVAALFPTIIGFIWYNPNVFGKAWMKASGMSHDQTKRANMPLLMILSLIFSFLLAFGLIPTVIHQMHLISLMVGDTGFGEEGTPIMETLNALMAEHGDKYRSFGHGAFHGSIAGVTFALPLIGLNALYEAKGFRYIAIHVGYWILTMALMGGLICGWQ